jgi:metallo-beta-lactamase family protein
VKAKIHTCGGLSAHADQQGLLDWYASIPNRPPVALVHGEGPAREVLAGKLRDRYRVDVVLSQPGMVREV